MFHQYALLQRGTNGQSILVKKRNFRMWSEDELRKMVTPELVSYILTMTFSFFDDKL